PPPPAIYSLSLYDALPISGHGVRAIRLREGDYVVGVGVCRPGATLLTVTEEGKGRRSLVDDYRITKRGGLGIRNYAKGGVAAVRSEEHTSELQSRFDLVCR